MAAHDEGLGAPAGGHHESVAGVAVAPASAHDHVGAGQQLEGLLAEAAHRSHAEDRHFRALVGEEAHRHRRARGRKAGAQLLDLAPEARSRRRDLGRAIERGLGLRGDLLGGKTVGPPEIAVEPAGDLGAEARA